MPYIFSAFRYGFGGVRKVVALAETFGLKHGIGYMFFFWFQQFNITQTLAWIMMFVVLMLVLEHAVFAPGSSWVFAWHPSHARDGQPSSHATARIGLPVPPLIRSGKPMNLKRPLPTSLSRLTSPSMWVKPRSRQT